MTEPYLLREGEFKRIAPLNRLYGTAKTEIPTPRFVVFYNGTAKQPERLEYRIVGEM